MPVKTRVKRRTWRRKPRGIPIAAVAVTSGHCRLRQGQKRSADPRRPDTRLRELGVPIIGGPELAAIWNLACPAEVELSGSGLSGLDGLAERIRERSAIVGVVGLGYVGVPLLVAAWA